MGMALGVTTMSFAKNATLVRLVWYAMHLSYLSSPPKKGCERDERGQSTNESNEKKIEKGDLCQQKTVDDSLSPSSRLLRTRQKGTTRHQGTGLFHRPVHLPAPLPQSWCLALDFPHFLTCLPQFSWLFGRQPATQIFIDPWWPLVTWIPIHPAFWEVLLGQALLGMTNNDE